VHNLSVASLEDLVSLDLNQVVEQILHMVGQIGAELLDRLARLHDLFDLFAREEVLHVHLLWHDLFPDVDHAHGEGQGEVDEEDGRTKLEQTEVLQVHVEEVALGALVSRMLFFRLFRPFALLLLLEVKLEDVVNIGLFTDSDVLFLLDERVLRVFREHLASRCFKLANDDLCRHNLVNQVPHRHLNDLDASQHVAPTDAIDDKLVDFLRTTLQEPSIVLTVVVGLIFCVAFSALALALLHVGIFTLIVILVQRSQQANHALKEE